MEPSPSAPAATAASPRTVTEETFPQVWPEIAAKLGGTLAMSLEKASRIAIPAPNNLVVHFGADYNAARQRCADPAALAKLEGVLKQLTGRPWQVRVEAAAGEAAAEPVAAEAAASKFRRVREEATREPLVKRAIELFDAQVTHTDPGFGSTQDG
jgi:hypothetical protein